MIKCEACGKEISEKAESCPSCGNPVPQKVKFKWYHVAFIFFGLLDGLLKVKPILKYFCNFYQILYRR